MFNFPFLFPSPERLPKAYPLEGEFWLGRAGEATELRGAMPRLGEAPRFLFGVGVEEAEEEEARLRRRFGVLLQWRRIERLGGRHSRPKSS